VFDRIPSAISTTLPATPTCRVSHTPDMTPKKTRRGRKKVPDSPSSIPDDPAATTTPPRGVTAPYGLRNKPEPINRYQPGYAATIPPPRTDVSEPVVSRHEEPGGSPPGPDPPRAESETSSPNSQFSASVHSNPARGTNAWFDHRHHPVTTHTEPRLPVPYVVDLRTTQTKPPDDGSPPRTDSTIFAAAQHLHYESASDEEKSEFDFGADDTGYDPDMDSKPAAKSTYPTTVVPPHLPAFPGSTSDAHQIATADRLHAQNRTEICDNNAFVIAPADPTLVTDTGDITAMNTPATVWRWNSRQSK
jgi:hypothetical protein